MAKAESTLTVSDLRVELRRQEDTVPILKGVSFAVARGSTLGLVGESGSGKSVACRCILDLLPKGMAVTEGSLSFQGRDLRTMSPSDLEELRGDRMALIPQDPLTALDPVIRIADQVAEALVIHRDITKTDAQAVAIDLLGKAGIPDPKQRSRSYPHELSGGMRQRVLIAMAIANEPELLLADEPTTSLDVTVQHQILKLLAELQERVGMSLVLVTHNFAVVAGICDSIAVMYSGYILETGSAHDVLREPLHPYTQALLAAMPLIETTDAGSRLYGIPGSQPALGEARNGCIFAPRCQYVAEECEGVDMSLVDAASGHATACPVRLK